MISTSPKLTPAQQQAVQQGLLPFMLRFGGRAWVRVGDAAAEIGLSGKFFRTLLEVGELEHLAASGKAERKSYCITTRSLILWLLRNSNVDHATHMDLYRDLFTQEPAAVLRQVIAHAQARLERISR